MYTIYQPANLIPVFVASFTDISKFSYLALLGATVKAQSTILPLMWVPKSIFMTSSYFKTVLSPAFGVKWAAQWLREQPGKKTIK